MVCCAVSGPSTSSVTRREFVEETLLALTAFERPTVAPRRPNTNGRRETRIGSGCRELMSKAIGEFDSVVDSTLTRASPFCRFRGRPSLSENGFDATEYCSTAVIAALGVVSF